MPNKTVAYFRPGQDFTARATTNVQARRLAYFAAPTNDEQLVHVAASRAQAGDVPAGVVGFDQSSGKTTHIAASGIQPIHSATEAHAGARAYDNGDGSVTTEAGGGEGAPGNTPVGVYVRPVSADAEAVVKLNLS